MKLSSAATGVLSGAACLSIASASSPACKDGVHVIVARGSNEPQGCGALQSVADNIASQIPDSDIVAVEYPASGALTQYAASQGEGVTQLTQLITNYGDACPGHRMVVLGNSQGAHVAGDALIGADYRRLPAFRTRPGLDSEYVDSICGVVLMGDPANVPTQKFLVGSSSNAGAFPRNNTYNYYTSGLSKRMQSYCDSGDNQCDSGDSSAVHEGNVRTHGDAAADFVVSQCNAMPELSHDHAEIKRSHVKRTYASNPPISGSNTVSRPPASMTGSYTVSRPTASGSYTMPRPPPPMASGNGTSGMNMTNPGGNSTMTGTITETVPDVTPAPTSNGDQGIYTTRATPAPTPSGPVANAAASLMGSGMAGYVVTVVLGSALAMALNL